MNGAGKAGEISVAVRRPPGPIVRFSRDDLLEHGRRELIANARHGPGRSGMGVPAGIGVSERWRAGDRGTVADLAFRILDETVHGGELPEPLIRKCAK